MRWTRAEPNAKGRSDSTVEKKLCNLRDRQHFSFVLSQLHEECIAACERHMHHKRARALFEFCGFLSRKRQITESSDRLNAIMQMGSKEHPVFEPA